MKITVLSLLFILLFPFALSADQLIFKNGTKKSGSIVEETETKVVLEIKIGKSSAQMAYPKEEIQEIIRNKDEIGADAPVQMVYEQKKEMLKSDDAKGHFDLAVFCVKKDLPQEAVEHFERACELDSTYEVEKRVHWIKLVDKLDIGAREVYIKIIKAAKKDNLKEIFKEMEELLIDYSASSFIRDEEAQEKVAHGMYPQLEDTFGLTLESIFFKSKELVVTRCPKCVGSRTVKCETCNGTGAMFCRTCRNQGYSKCSECRGTMKIRCEKCDGDGIFSRVVKKYNFESKQKTSTTVHSDCQKCTDGEITCKACTSRKVTAQKRKMKLKLKKEFPDGVLICKDCNGTGKKAGTCRYESLRLWYHENNWDRDFKGCDGTGKSVCSLCDGSGLRPTGASGAIYAGKSVAERDADLARIEKMYNAVMAGRRIDKKTFKKGTVLETGYIPTTRRSGFATQNEVQSNEGDGIDIKGKLLKLQELLDAGLITQEDYEIKKEKLLEAW